MDWFYVFLIAVVVCATAYNIVQARQQRRIALKPADPRMCSCGHGCGAHADGLGGCNQDIKRPYYDNLGDRNGYEWVPCRCLKFDGQPPIDVLGWSPPVIPRRSEDE